MFCIENSFLVMFVLDIMMIGMVLKWSFMMFLYCFVSLVNVMCGCFFIKKRLLIIGNVKGFGGNVFFFLIFFE